MKKQKKASSFNNELEKQLGIPKYNKPNELEKHLGISKYNELEKKLGISKYNKPKVVNGKKGGNR